MDLFNTYLELYSASHSPPPYQSVAGDTSLQVSSAYILLPSYCYQ
jgi:hypothetical protein